MPRKQDGFQPMELELSNDITSNRSWTSYSTITQEHSKVVVVALLMMTLVLLFLVISPDTMEETTVWGCDDETSSIRNRTKEVSKDTSFLLPPIARRDTDRVVQFGIPPPDWNPSLPRQSQESTIPLLDPPRLVPDPYGWLRDDDRTDPEILAHLHAENNYTQYRLSHLHPIQEELYEELLQYMDETSHSFPVLDRSYYYYRRTVQGQPYPIHYRAPIPMDDSFHSPGAYLQHHLALWDGQKDTPILPQEVVYMDENQLSQGHEFFNLGSIEISPSENRLAYTVDTTGSELYQLRVIDISSGETLFMTEPDEDFLTEEVTWGWDDDTLVYSKPDDSQRSYQIYRRQLSLGIEELLYEETDVTYWVGFERSMDNQYLLVETASTESSEVYYWDLQSSTSTRFRCISKRRLQVLYSVEHFKGYWWILSNINDPNGDMQLFTVPVGKEQDDLWTRVLDPTGQRPLLEEISMEGMIVFQHHVVIQGRFQGLSGVWILEVDEDNASLVTLVQRVEFTIETAHTVSLAANKEYNTTTLLLQYVSMVTPQQLIEVDLYHPNMDDRLVVFEKPVPGYQKSMYACHRIHVLSRDGRTTIPVSLVYRLSTWESVEEGTITVPIHLYAYGAYGESIDDEFASTRLPLLDRGMIFAVAHVRGGGEMGRTWYMDGKLLNKHKTFDDFVDVAQYLIDQQWTTPKLLSCEGRSAGGLTMGASLNQAPELFRAAILGVPFVDLIVTMMDASIPLTTSEWREWGNPNEAEYFDAMLAYAPMNNVQTTVYPSMLLLAGLFDPRVAYWEPAKLTATLRYITTHDPERPVCLRTDMTSGHFSASDRYKHIQERSFEYAFILDQLGVLSK